MVDFSKLESQEELDRLIKEGKVTKLWGNVWISGKRHEVYSIAGKIHGIGGIHGENSLWAHPVDLSLNYASFSRFDGEPVCWGIRTESVNVYKEYWSSPKIAINKTTVWITLNSHDIYPVVGELNYAVHKAFTMIVDLKENMPIDFKHYRWKESAVGLRFFYKNQPATVVSISNMLQISAKLDTGSISFMTTPFDRHVTWSNEATLPPEMEVT